MRVGCCDDLCLVISVGAGDDVIAVGSFVLNAEIKERVVINVPRSFNIQLIAIAIEDRHDRAAQEGGPSGARLNCCALCMMPSRSNGLLNL